MTDAPHIPTLRAIAEAADESAGVLQDDGWTREARGLFNFAVILRREADARDRGLEAPPASAGGEGGGVEPGSPSAATASKDSSANASAPPLSSTEGLVADQNVIEAWNRRPAPVQQTGDGVMAAELNRLSRPSGEAGEAVKRWREKVAGLHPQMLDFWYVKAGDALCSQVEGLTAQGYEDRFYLNAAKAGEKAAIERAEAAEARALAGKE